LHSIENSEEPKIFGLNFAASGRRDINHEILEIHEKTRGKETGGSTTEIQRTQRRRKVSGGSIRGFVTFGQSVIIRGFDIGHFLESVHEVVPARAFGAKDNVLGYSGR
jgi:hypothetical protein